ncbi:MAG TPA: hypothetical protein VEV17_15030 [Bryobacteraceae bacterium]|nr:hypothetical protein [Bryobacteraceae bacterium]
MTVVLTFWIAVALILYTYLGYPLALMALRLVIHRQVRKQTIRPSVSLLIPAYNEAAVISRKVATHWLSTIRRTGCRS